MDTDAEVLKTVKADPMPVIEHSAEDSLSRLTFSNFRVRRAVVYVAVAVGLVVATAILRGSAISEWGLLNPDEAGFMASARAALLSPVPWSTWETGTTGPYWTLFLAGLGALGRGPALVATVVWWFPIATTWLVGYPMNFSELSTEYLPMLLVVASALVPREQLAARPWLFFVVGV